MAEARQTLTFNLLTISQQLPRLLIPSVQKQFRQMELLMAISVNNHLLGSQYSIILLHYNVTQQQLSNNFLLKWVNGTTVSKCYGCNGRIPNPPTTPLENLIIARKDVRHYRHRTTGQLQCSSQPQNLHFHLSLRCVVAKYPMFLRSDLKN